MSQIRTVVLCLFWNQGRVLVEQHFDEVKQDFYCRPLGGGVEFGERCQDAIIREIREEIGADIAALRLLGVLENIFTCDGQTGHEIVFVYDARFKDEGLYSQEVVKGYEHGNDSHFVARWRSLEQISSSGVRLVPEGLHVVVSSLQ